MKYVQQALIIFLFTLLGEVLHVLLPLPVPAAIYGLLLLFLCLCLGIIKPDQLRQVSGFFISTMGILFIAPTVNVMDSWQLLSGYLGPIAIITVVTTVVVFVVSGKITALFTGKEQDHD